MSWIAPWRRLEREREREREGGGEKRAQDLVRKGVYTAAHRFV